MKAMGWIGRPFADAICSTQSPRKNWFRFRGHVTPERRRAIAERVVRSLAFTGLWNPGCHGDQRKR